MGSIECPVALRVLGYQTYVAVEMSVVSAEEKVDGVAQLDFGGGRLT